MVVEMTVFCCIRVRRPRRIRKIKYDSGLGSRVAVTLTSAGHCFSR